MSVYKNRVDEVAESINSILNQSYKNIEFIIVEDGNCESIKRLLINFSQRNSRVRVLNHKINMGLTKSLIEGVKIAQGELVARQDADDWSRTDRIEKQVDWFKKVPAGVLVGAWYDITQDGLTIGTVKPVNSDVILKKLLYKTNPFCHSSTMFSRSAYFAVGGYDPNFITTQDLDLWMRLTRRGAFGIVEESLVNRRITSGSITNSRSKWRQVRNGFVIRSKYILSHKAYSEASAVLITTVKHILISIFKPRFVLKIKLFLRAGRNN
jgi:glycosyltransferase involved in cell wall biosynthesis